MASKATQNLFSAIQEGRLEGVRQAIAEGADVNAQDPESMEGSRPLHYAAIHDVAKIAQLLIEHDADPQLRDDAEQIVWEVAKDNQSWDVQRVLAKYNTADTGPTPDRFTLEGDWQSKNSVTISADHTPEPHEEGDPKIDQEDISKPGKAGEYDESASTKAILRAIKTGTSDALKRALQEHKPSTVPIWKVLSQGNVQTLETLMTYACGHNKEHFRELCDTVMLAALKSIGNPDERAALYSTVAALGGDINARVENDDTALEKELRQKEVSNACVLALLKGGAELKERSSNIHNDVFTKCNTIERLIRNRKFETAKVVLSNYQGKNKQEIMDQTLRDISDLTGPGHSTLLAPDVLAAIRLLADAGADIQKIGPDLLKSYALGARQGPWRGPDVVRGLLEMGVHFPQNPENLIFSSNKIKREMIRDYTKCQLTTFFARNPRLPNDFYDAAGSFTPLCSKCIDLELLPELLAPEPWNGDISALFDFYRKLPEWQKRTNAVLPAFSGWFQPENWKAKESEAIPFFEHMLSAFPPSQQQLVRNHVDLSPFRRMNAEPARQQASAVARFLKRRPEPDSTPGGGL